jgi:hypothetical protein
LGKEKELKTMQFTKVGLAVVSIGLVLGAVPAFAGLTTYPDQASWTAAVSGVTTVTIPDVGGFGSQYFGTGDASVTYGGVVFSASSALGNGDLFNVSPEFSTAPPVVSDQQATSGLENILITFPTPVSAFALNYGTFGGSAVTFTLSNGDTFAQGSTGSGYFVPDFAGATDNSFTSVLLTSPDYVLNVNNVSYANANATTPEPSFYAALAVGLIGLAFFQRRRRRNA